MFKGGIPLLLTLLAVFFIGVFLALGKWQIDRKQEKRAVLQEYQKRFSQPAVDLHSINPPYEHWRYRPVRFIGQPLNEQQLLLDNQVKKGQVGYNVLTPFRVSENNVEIVLVDRGWVKQGASRGDIPDITIAPDRREISGHIYVPLGEPFVLGDIVEKENSWPAVIQHLDFAVLKSLFGDGLAPFTVRLSPALPDGYLRKWQTIAASPDRHLGYATMFFAFAMVIFIMYTVLLLRIRAQILKRK